jgi:hypothetical protein
MRFKGVGAIVNSNAPIDLVIEAVNLKDQTGDPLPPPPGVHEDTLIEYEPKSAAHNMLVNAANEGQTTAYPQINLKPNNAGAIDVNGVQMEKTAYFRAFLVHSGTKTLIPSPPGVRLSLLNLEDAEDGEEARAVLRASTANMTDHMAEILFKLNLDSGVISSSLGQSLSTEKPEGYLTASSDRTASSTDGASNGVLASFVFQDTSVLTFGLGAEGEDGAGAAIGRNFVLDIANVVPEGSGCTGRSQSKNLRASALHSFGRATTLSTKRTLLEKSTPVLHNKPLSWVASRQSFK